MTRPRRYTAAWLTAHGYDGLAGEGCGCDVDDLYPCQDGYDAGTCKPAWLCKKPICARGKEWPGEPLYCTRHKGMGCEDR